ncbi:MAG: serine hydrolase domain-containing protein, partial [Pseudomonadota bacterium]
RRGAGDRRGDPRRRRHGREGPAIATVATPGRPGDGRPWPWWSVTKTAIAACALRLADRGRLDLDAPLPDGAFSTRHLLGHTAGLSCYTALPDYHAAVARGDRPWPEAEVLARTRADTPRAAPGAAWAYSNVGYLLARQHLERLEDAALATLLQREVLDPAGCRATRMATGREVLPHLPASAGYDFGWVYHGCLLGPADDAVRMMDAVLGGLLSPTALTDGRWLGGGIPGRPWTEARYGLGLMCGDMRGTAVTGHSGGGPFSTCAVYAGPRGIAAAFSRHPSEASAERAVARIVTPSPPPEAADRHRGR